MGKYIQPADVRNKTGWDTDIASDEVLSSSSFIPISEMDAEEILINNSTTFENLSDRGKLYFKEAVICLVCNRVCGRRITLLQEQIRTTKEVGLSIELATDAKTLENQKQNYFLEYQQLINNVIASINAKSSIPLMKIISW